EVFVVLDQDAERLVLPAWRPGLGSNAGLALVAEENAADGLLQPGVRGIALAGRACLGGDPIQRRDLTPVPLGGQQESPDQDTHLRVRQAPQVAEEGRGRRLLEVAFLEEQVVARV